MDFSEHLEAEVEALLSCAEDRLGDIEERVSDLRGRVDRDFQSVSSRLRVLAFALRPGMEAGRLWLN